MRVLVPSPSRFAGPSLSPQERETLAVAARSSFSLGEKVGMRG